VPFTLTDVVPWGRSFVEYRQMFALRDDDLAGPVLGCGDGPASFNAEATRRGARVVSMDPLFQFDERAIRQRIADTSEVVLAQARANAHEFVWDTIRSVDELERVRMGAMTAFLEDYARPPAGRYIAGALPYLPFQDGAFTLALCSHFLFLYSEQYSEAFHVASVRELCRVAPEVRIFPLLELGGRASRHIAPVAGHLSAAGLTVSFETVPYEVQRGGNQMLRIRR
jgi:SAM-dependent methyltransferase